MSSKQYCSVRRVSEHEAEVCRNEKVTERINCGRNMCIAPISL
jgi:hypothetical protein